MNATIYWNKSDKRYVDKDLQKVKDIVIQFIEDSSIINPRFKLSTPSQALEGNYIFVPDLGRYYYITNYTVSSGYIVIDCHVDVLMSFSAQLKKEHVILKRQESEYNVYLDDPEFKIYQPTNVMTFNFPNGFDKDVQEYILCVIGRTV